MREREILVVVENRGERWGRKGRDDWSAKLRRHEAPTFDSFVFPCSLSPPSSFFAFCFSFLLFIASFSSLLVFLENFLIKKKDYKFFWSIKENDDI